jgi:hypothetical protein
MKFDFINYQKKRIMYPSEANNEIVVLPTIRISVGEIISWIENVKIAWRGKSQYLNGNVNHSFQLFGIENDEFLLRKKCLSYFHLSVNDLNDVCTGIQSDCPSEKTWQTT